MMNKSKLKNIAAITLVGLMIFGSVGSCFANEIKNETNTNITITKETNNDGQSYKVIKDNEKERIAEEQKGSMKYVYSFDKETNVLTTNCYDLKTNNCIESNSKDLSEIFLKAESKVENSSTKRTKRRASHYQHTFANYEYESNSNCTEYELRNKGTRVTLTLKKHGSDIKDYISAVDTLNAAEWAIAASGGATAVWAVATALSDGLTVSEAATASGVLAADVIAYNLAVDNCINIWNTCVMR